MKSLIVLFLALAAVAAVPFDVRPPVVFPRKSIAPMDQLDGRIANGQNAAPGQFPYQVGLELLIGLSKGFCGGSLIANNWVLTAAHCTDGVTLVTVLIGGTTRNDAKVVYRIQRDRIIIHEGYNSRKLLNDISLISIPPVKWSGFIQPVGLPSKASIYSSYVGEQAIVSGWGNMGDSSPGVAPVLQYAVVSIIANPECSKNFFNLVTSGNICVATKNGKSPCKGDSGGPLVLESAPKIQVGSVSFGSMDGCENGFPVAFTRITAFLDWIEKNSGVSS